MHIAEGAHLMNKLDAETRVIAADMAKFVDALLEEDVKAAADLRAQASDALISMGAAGLVSVILAGAFGLWLSSTKIARPLAQLAQKMRALAEGDLAVKIEGQERGDEVGEMSKAVLVFQAAAVENARLERAATEAAARADGERARNEQAQREAIEQERAVVARSIGAALSKLAAKDLTYRMPADIPEAYRKLQADFNAAISQLEEAMRGRERQHGRDSVGHAGNIDRFRRSVAPHRAAGGEPRGDRRGARRDHRDGEEIGRRARAMRARSSPPPTRTPRRARSSCARRSRRWTRSPNPPSRSARSSA